MRNEKKLVQMFYDTYGWNKHADGAYKDTKLFVDMQPGFQNYYHKVHMRVKGFINPHGEYFLDAGSGAIPNSEYLEYSSGYKRHICVDFSEKALLEAKSKLKARGLYVLADITNLPFKDGIFDATICPHVLYHIPQDEQESTILNLYRTLKNGGTCVIIYSWPTSLPNKIVSLVRFIIKNIKGLISMIPGISLIYRNFVKPTKQKAGEEKPEQRSPPFLYFKSHPYQWFQETLPNDWDIDIRSWRSVDRAFIEMFVFKNFTGRLLTELLFRLETIFPHALAKIGRYAMIIIRK